MSDLIDREALLRQIDIDSEGEPGYYGDTWKFIDTIKSMPPAEHGTNLAEVGTDCISRQAAIDYFVTNVGFHDEDGYPIEDECELREIWTGYFDGIPSAQPKNENLKFLEFLWNTINPNEMEQYLEMYSSKEVKSNG